MNYNPPRPVGSDAEAVFMQAVWDRVFGPSRRILNSTTVTADYTPQGIYLHSKGGGGGRGLQILPFHVTTLHGDDVNSAGTFTAKKGGPGGIDANGADFKIIKCVAAHMPSSEVIDGTEFTYAYASDNFRTQYQDASILEYHVLHPRYRIYDVNHKMDSLIYAVKLSSSEIDSAINNDTNAQWLELSPQRFWAYQFDQSGPP